MSRLYRITPFSVGIGDLGRVFGNPPSQAVFDSPVRFAFPSGSWLFHLQLRQLEDGCRLFRSARPFSDSHRDKLSRLGLNREILGRELQTDAAVIWDWFDQPESMPEGLRFLVEESIGGPDLLQNLRSLYRKTRWGLQRTPEFWSVLHRVAGRGKGDLGLDPSWPTLRTSLGRLGMTEGDLASDLGFKHVLGVRKWCLSLAEPPASVELALAKASDRTALKGHLSRLVEIRGTRVRRRPEGWATFRRLLLEPKVPLSEIRSIETDPAMILGSHLARLKLKGFELADSLGVHLVTIDFWFFHLDKMPEGLRLALELCRDREEAVHFLHRLYRPDEARGVRRTEGFWVAMHELAGRLPEGKVHPAGTGLPSFRELTARLHIRAAEIYERLGTSESAFTDWQTGRTDSPAGIHLALGKASSAAEAMELIGCLYTPRRGRGVDRAPDYWPRFLELLSRSNAVSPSEMSVQDDPAQSAAAPRFAALVRRLGLTLSRLAEGIGISHPVVKGWSEGKRKPPEGLSFLLSRVDLPEDLFGLFPLIYERGPGRRLRRTASWLPVMWRAARVQPLEMFEYPLNPQARDLDLYGRSGPKDRTRILSGEFLKGRGVPRRQTAEELTHQMRRLDLSDRDLDEVLGLEGDQYVPARVVVALKRSQSRVEALDLLRGLVIRATAAHVARLPYWGQVLDLKEKLLARGIRPEAIGTAWPLSGRRDISVILTLVSSNRSTEVIQNGLRRFLRPRVMPAFYRQDRPNRILREAPDRLGISEEAIARRLGLEISYYRQMVRGMVRVPRKFLGVVRMLENSQSVEEWERKMTDAEWVPPVRKSRKGRSARPAEPSADVAEEVNRLVRRFWSAIVGISGRALRPFRLADGDFPSDLAQEIVLDLQAAIARGVPPTSDAHLLAWVTRVAKQRAQRWYFSRKGISPGEEMLYLGMEHVVRQLGMEPGNLRVEDLMRYDPDLDEDSARLALDRYLEIHRIVKTREIDLDLLQEEGPLESGGRRKIQRVTVWSGEEPEGPPEESDDEFDEDL